MKELKAYLASRRQMVDQALEGYLPQESKGGTIAKAMRYSVFAGGKRLRPILCLAAAEALGAPLEPLLPCACALEMIHTYSLVHDDLPAMDNDDLRRGAPTSHKVFGEGMAVLAGDGLLTLAAYMLCGPQAETGLPLVRVARAAQVVLRASGHEGMVGGQAADLEGEQQEPDLVKVRFIHTLKTGALISASLQSGAILAGADTEDEQRLARYGRRIGLAFQIADDLLDLTGDPGQMGKAAGQDQVRGKMTYPQVAGPAAAKESGWQLVQEARELLEPLGEPAWPLRDLAWYIMERTH